MTNTVNEISLTIDLISKLSESPIVNKERFLYLLENPDVFNFLVGLYSETFASTHEFFQKTKQMNAVMSPVTTSSISSPMGLGSDSLPVDISLDGQTMNLADSMQFFLEYLLRGSESGVYYIMPSFRGEDHDETHLNQFFHAEAEIIGGLVDVMKLIEEYIAALSNTVFNFLDTKDCVSLAADKYRESINAGSFPRISYYDAVAEIKDIEGAIDQNDGYPIITRIGENALCDAHGIFWLTNFPAGTVPFYQKRSDHDNSETQTADLVFPVIGEIVGCGARHIDDTALAASIVEMKIHSPESYNWYVKMKEVTPLETAGFGLGVERFLAWALDMGDIRQLALLSRLKADPIYV